MIIFVLGIRTICVKNVDIKETEAGIHIIKECGELVFVPNHHISSYHIYKDAMAIAVKMTKKQFALLETFLKDIGGVVE